MRVTHRVVNEHNKCLYSWVCHPLMNWFLRGPFGCWESHIGWLTNMINAYIADFSFGKNKNFEIIYNSVKSA